MFVLWQCGCKQHTRHGADLAILECAPTRLEQQLYSRLLLVPGALEHRGSAHNIVGAHSIAHFQLTQSTEQESKVHSTEMVHTDSHTLGHKQHCIQSTASVRAGAQNIATQLCTEGAQSAHRRHTRSDSAYNCRGPTLFNFAHKYSPCCLLLRRLLTPRLRHTNINGIALYPSIQLCKTVLYTPVPAKLSTIKHSLCNTTTTKYNYVHKNFTGRIVNKSV